MLSKWSEYKEGALNYRRSGYSITEVERILGIPRSTLSGWFKHVPLTLDQKTKLNKSKLDGLAKARQKASEWHTSQRVLREQKALKSAEVTLSELNTSTELLDLALAMLYLGEGAKSGSTSLASSNPMIIKFVLKVLRLNYGITEDMVRCDLHLRMDQNPIELKKYWSEQLGLPMERFKNVSLDKRSAGKPTYDHYKGVCVLNCGQIAIQRKLMCLYTLFCEQVISQDEGV